MQLQRHDEATRDPELVAFRERLLRALDARDWPALQELLYHRVAYGRDFLEQKVAGFGHFWRMPDPQSPLWWKLANALRWGGRFGEGGLFEAPGIVWPEGLDLRRTLLVNGALRDGPHGAELARLDGEVVTLVPTGDEPFDEHYPYHNSWEHHGQHGYAWDNFLHVRTEDGRTGWVHCTDVLSPLEQRAYLKKADGGMWWRVMSFVTPA